jgi:GTPase
VLIVDTVGFIQKLPHHLVAAFHATLREVAEAQLLLHVVDAADPRWKFHQKVVEEVIASLQAGHLPRLLVFNKADLLPPSQRSLLKREGRLLVSARTGEGLPELMEEAQTRLEEALVEKEILLPHGRRDLLPLLYGAGRVLSEEPAADGSRLRIRMDRQNWGRLEKELKAGKPGQSLVRGRGAPAGRNGGRP